MLCLQFSKLPFTLNLRCLQPLIPLLLDRHHILFYLLSLLLLHFLDLLHLQTFSVPVPLGGISPCKYLLELEPELSLDAVDDLVLPALHLQAIRVEAVDDLVPLGLGSPPALLAGGLQVVPVRHLLGRQVSHLLPQSFVVERDVLLSGDCPRIVRLELLVHPIQGG